MMGRFPIKSSSFVHRGLVIITVRLNQLNSRESPTSSPSNSKEREERRFCYSVDFTSRDTETHIHTMISIL